LFFYKESDSIKLISDRDTTFCYEMIKEKLYLRVVQRRARSSHCYPIEVFSCPMVVFFDSETTYKQLYIKLWELCKRFLSNNNTDDNKKKKTSSSSTSESTEKNNLLAKSIDWDSVELDFKNLPFYISMVSGGIYCKLAGCNKMNCNGCNIEPSDTRVMFTKEDNGNTLAITWSANSIKTMWSKLGFTSSVKIHPSVEELKEKSSECTLMDCIDLFTKNEQLGPEDPWYCPRCEEQQQAYKKFDLWKLPNILVIQIKRFSSNRYQKLSMNVTFPVDILDISQYVINDQEKKVSILYMLYRIISDLWVEDTIPLSVRMMV